MLTRARASLVALSILGGVLSMAQATGCAALRQNMRGQELSYRGAWYCEAAGCEAKDMVKSTRGTREGTVNINTVELAPRAAMVFTAAAPFEALVAVARDCKGKQVLVPEADVVAAGKHEVGDDDARQSWIVWIDPSSLAGLERGSGSCAVWTVEATATWSDSATYSLRAGVQIEG